MSAYQELEKNATNYALEAVRLDKQGSRGMAITMYQKSIESLLHLVQLYPEYGLNKVYVQKAVAYQERIKAIQGAVGVPSEQPHAEVRNGGREGETKKSEGGKSSYEELLVTEKLNVKWADVVGLDHAKKAVKEAIIYPVQRPVPVSVRVATGNIALRAARLRENIAGSSRRYGNRRYFRLN